MSEQPINTGIVDNNRAKDEVLSPEDLQALEAVGVDMSLLDSQNYDDDATVDMDSLVEDDDLDDDDDCEDC